VELVWLEPALDDLDAIHAYVAAENSAAADRLLSRILGAGQNLVDMPGMGRIGRVRRTRELVVTGTRYLAVCRVRPRHIEIIAVRHAARRWPKRFRR
jgi:plasmid stabilization system protein ParE